MRDESMPGLVFHVAGCPLPHFEKRKVERAHVEILMKFLQGWTARLWKELLAKSRFMPGENYLYEQIMRRRINFLVI